MLFHPKNRKAINIIWTILSILVAVGMVVLYLPIFQQ
jgi:hypothetical protein